MRILAFDTATRATSVALDEVELRDDPPAGTRPRHTTRLMPLIVEVLERAATEWAEIDRIAVGIGPGTFTGLRIGVATARSLSRARGIPLVGVSTLESLALNASGADPATARANDAHDAEAVLAVLDARRGEVFAAGWQPGHQWRPLLAPSALSPDELAGLATAFGLRTLAIGEGAVEFRPVLERAGALIPADGSALNRVTAVNHSRLARKLAATDPDQVRPEYLRLPDAELARIRTGTQ
jgi:tRNA threonylcarbamoyladenosine biosynthesis protein TsaB